MIVIRSKSGAEFRYEGNVDLEVSEATDQLLYVHADRSASLPNELQTISYKICDIFWLSEVESIQGEGRLYRG
jgi:hypothetical protein